MRFRDLVNSALGAARDWREAVDSIRAEYGRGASRQIADRFGVSQRTAQKWLKGSQAPDAASGRRDAVRQGGEARRVAADALRQAQALDVGDVKVQYDGKDAGSRKVGTLHVDDHMRDQLDRVADLIEQGDYDAAEQAYSDAILDGYSGQRARDDRRILRGTLKVDDFGDGGVI